MRRRMLGRAGALGGAVVLSVVATACEPAPTEGWRSELVSVNGTETAGPNRASSGNSISPDGTKVLFSTSATDMGFPDLVQDASPDIYMRDLASGETVRITQTPDGTDGGNGASTTALFTADGSTVVLLTFASNLGPSDTNGVSDIYAYDLSTRTMRLLTAGSSGTGANGPSQSLVMSVARDRIAFRTAATDLGPVDANGADDIYALDLGTGESQLVSVTSSGAAAGGLPGPTSTSFSADGRYVTFISSAPGVVTSPPPGTNAYVRDLDTETTTLVSIGTGGAALPSGDGATSALIDAAGRQVAFVYRTTSGAVSRDQLYLRDIATQTTTLVSQQGGVAGNGSSRGPSFSPDGARVAFTSDSSNLAGDDTNGRNDAFVYDIAARALTLVSYDQTGKPSNSVSQSGTFSPDGRKLSFVSAGANIVAGFPAVSSDLYTRDLVTGRAEMVSVDPSGTAGGNFVTSPGRFTPDGRAIVFGASSSTLDGRPVVPGVGSVFIARLEPHPTVDLGVTVTRRDQPAEGAAWTVDVTVASAGPSTATSARVAYLLPYVGAGSTVSTSDGTCTTSYRSDGSTLFDCTLSALAPDDTRTISISNAAPLSPNPQASVAHVSGPRIFDPVPADNTATLVLDAP